MEGTRDGGENKEMRCKQKGVQIGNKSEWDNGERTMRQKPCPNGGRNRNQRWKLGDDRSCAGSAGLERFITDKPTTATTISAKRPPLLIASLFRFSEEGACIAIWVHLSCVLACLLTCPPQILGPATEICNYVVPM